MTDSVQEYVLVGDVGAPADEQMELPANPSDGSLSLKTLSHSFPGAIGLKYKAPSGATRGLLIDDSGEKFFAPPEGWAGTTFLVIYNKTAPAAAVGGVKRKGGLDDEGGLKKPYVSQVGTLAPQDLIVLGLAYHTTTETLKSYFTQYGEVIMSLVKTDYETGKSKGFGFIRFAEYPCQVRALSEAEHYIDGRLVSLKLSKPQGGAQQKHMGESYHCEKIFVARMSEDIKEPELRATFEAEAQELDPNCQITDIFIPRPFRSFGFVSFSNPAVVDAIVRKETFIINGTSVVVSPAVPREPLPGMPGAKAAYRSPTAFTSGGYLNYAGQGGGQQQAASYDDNANGAYGYGQEYPQMAGGGAGGYGGHADPYAAMGGSGPDAYADAADAYAAYAEFYSAMAQARQAGAYTGSYGGGGRGGGGASTTSFTRGAAASSRPVVASQTAGGGGGGLRNGPEGMQRAGAGGAGGAAAGGARPELTAAMQHARAIAAKVTAGVGKPAAGQGVNPWSTNAGYGDYGDGM